jgi:transcriptional regulator with XRE-family HTH domain
MNVAARQLGQLIAQARGRSGMTQATLGRDVCVSQSYIYWIEAGKHVPRAQVRRRLIASLDLSEKEVERLEQLTQAAAPLRRGSPEYLAMLKRNGFKPGHATGPRFAKGHVPWTAGLKGIHLSPATEFKPGHLGGAAAQKLHPIGTVTIRRDHGRGRKRRWIKVRPHGPGVEAYIPLARYLYERQHGPIPPGFFVVHADGDQLNDDLKNLMLMTRQQQLAWQKRIRPNMEAKRKRRASLGSRQRWSEYRQLKTFQRKQEPA